MHFGKSLLIALSATGTSAGAVVIAGLLTNSGPLSPGNPSRAPEPPGPLSQRTIVMAPVPVDPKGYALKGLEQDDQIFVSVEMTLAHKRDRKSVCNLVPRLRAAVLRDLGPKFWSQPTLTIVEGDSVNGFVQARFHTALGWDAVEKVSVRFVNDRRHAPKPNCGKVVHGGWQAWIRSGPLKDR